MGSRVQCQRYVQRPIASSRLNYAQRREQKILIALSSTENLRESCSEVCQSVDFSTTSMVWEASECHALVKFLRFRCDGRFGLRKVFQYAGERRSSL